MLAAGFRYLTSFGIGSPTVSHKGRDYKWAGEYRCNRCRYGRDL